MKTLEKGQDRVQKICDKIRKDTIDPAKDEAKLIIEAAKKHSEKLIQEAELHADQLIKQAKVQIENERNVFHSTLQQAGKQFIESLRQQIETKLFDDQLKVTIEKESKDAKLVANMINTIITAIQKEGISVDFNAVLPKTFRPEDVTIFLLDSVKQQLIDKGIDIGHFAGGAKIRLKDKKMILDLSDEAIKELISNFVRKDFRQIIFGR